MKVVDEEIFGPVVCAIPFDELDEVATQMNQTPYGLAGAIWTEPPPTPDSGSLVSMTRLAGSLGFCGSKLSDGGASSMRRLIELVPVSACWKGSKMTFSLGIREFRY